MSHVRKMLKSYSQFNESVVNVIGQDGKSYTIKEVIKIVNPAVRDITINIDGSIDVLGAVLLTKVSETGKLPFRFNKVDGSFRCTGCGLTSLEGGPKEVTYEYDCSNNNLTKLTYEDIPNSVGGNFIIANNPNLIKEGGIWSILEEDVVGGSIAFEKYVFGEDFNSDGGALTLDPCEVRQDDSNITGIELSRTHPDGWTITGIVKEDYYEWVNDFSAIHSELGKVWGNFEDNVFASSKEAYDDFFKKHSPNAWDYGDI